MKFNEKLQTLRKEKGWSQEQLADQLDISRQAVSKWESGLSYPDMENLVALSNLFQVSLDVLVKGTAFSDTAGVTEPSSLTAFPWWNYEYKSRRSFGKVPLVHVNIGSGQRSAKGIIAVGNRARGVVSVGLLSTGVVSVGLASAGVLSVAPLSLGLLGAVGGISLGTVSVGALAVGIYTFGAVSIGVFSLGGLAVASHVAIGQHAAGHIAIGKTVQGVKTLVDTSAHHRASVVSAAEVRRLVKEEFPGLWKWVAPLVLSLFP